MKIISKNFESIKFKIYKKKKSNLIDDRKHV